MRLSFVFTGALIIFAIYLASNPIPTRPIATVAQSNLESRVISLERQVSELSSRVDALDGQGDSSAEPVEPVNGPTPTTKPESRPRANRASNLRDGPGTNYPVVGSATQGMELNIVGCDTNACDWYKLSDGKWIAAFLVMGASPPYPVDPTTVPTPTPTKTSPPPAPPAPPTATPTPTGIACDIKGNISYNTGEKIYHVPGQEYYDETQINTGAGERWFCTEEEARAAGWRKAYR